MIGSKGPRMLRATMAHADAWNAWYNDTGNAASGVAPLRALVDDACREVGREPGDVERTVAVLVRDSRRGRTAPGRSGPGPAAAGPRRARAAGGGTACVRGRRHQPRPARARSDHPRVDPRRGARAGDPRRGIAHMASSTIRTGGSVVRGPRASMPSAMRTADRRAPLARVRTLAAAVTIGLVVGCLWRFAAVRAAGEPDPRRHAGRHAGRPSQRTGQGGQRLPRPAGGRSPDRPEQREHRWTR